jgi:hypothetical protein
MQTLYSNDTPSLQIEQFGIASIQLEYGNYSCKKSYLT